MTFITSRVGILKVEGYSVSPSIAASSVFLLLSYVALGLAPSAYVFATLTNLCYIGAGLYREAASVIEGHTAASLVGQMAGGALILVVMGASSFAYHRSSVLSSPAHTLDILFGWLLVLHGFYVVFAVSILAFLKWRLPDHLDSPGILAMRLFLSGLFLFAVTILMAAYDTIYGHQLLFYLILGPGAAIFAAGARFVLVYEGGAFKWHAARIAAAELVALLTAVLAAIYSQGEIIGRTITKDSHPREYDLFHGNWHFLLAVVLSVLYSRAADTARIIKGTHMVCVCNLPILDWIGEGLVFVYALACIILKEAVVDIDTATIILGTTALGFAVHGIATLAASAAAATASQARVSPLTRAWDTEATFFVA